MLFIVVLAIKLSLDTNIVHFHQEFFVGTRVFQTLLHEVHRLNTAHIANKLTDDIHAIERTLVEQQVVAAGRTLDEIDSWEDALVGKCAIQLQFHVTRSLEFFKNHLIHLRTSVGQCRCNDGERTTISMLRAAPKEAFRLLKRIGIDTTREDFTRSGCNSIEGAR